MHILSLSCTPFKCHAPPLSQVLMSLSTHFYASTCSKILIVQVKHLEGPNLSMDNWVLYSFPGLTSEIPFIFAFQKIKGFKDYGSNHPVNRFRGKVRDRNTSLEY